MMDLGLLLEEICEVFSHRTTNEVQHDIRLTTDGDLSLDADAHQLRQVIWNLLNNAADVMPEGGRIDIICKRLPANNHGIEQVGVQVLDRGPGLSPEQAQRIFDPFYTTKADGTGLGLAVAQRIIQDHEGTLRVESDLDRGSCFIITLPVVARLPMLPAEPSAVEPR
jgi:signal transduction histidine kinase